MRIRLILFTLLLFWGLNGCSLKEKAINEFESKCGLLGIEEELSGFKYVLLLPGEGCSGCISSTEKFVKTLDSSDEILVIFTSIRSKKVLKLKTGINLDQEFLVFDENSILNEGRTYSIYPTLFNLEKGKVSSFDYISPNSPINLNDLKSN
ncbi:hypothetical protein BXY85_1643 [Roseivirga pacifica]|uniref:Uncharacterized protein n=1 Tax=Roseivirga pacifica TaxID=1267423 RepID=A0A1I0MQV5_9BACT|nr:hypothetical protein [Roseivirga pacifica]MCO6359166.1 hypothetical protein [Roseivirga pacifica]MCO6365198.1 hypothetical protein [Roseivirga pacifica]MCO6372072.1 hypothetical protein [Roseivirga pacifica]MCO6375817.1 hypothetical protein [Roseivirga pacifica]MCO6379450.1 hypothetical protein [Roseivirga pacifica]